MSLGRPPSDLQWTMAPWQLTYEDNSSRNQGLLSSQSGLTKEAFYKSGSVTADELNIYDVALFCKRISTVSPCTDLLFFDSPVNLRSYMGPNNNYLYPCITEYMQAPDDFGIDDFNNFTLDYLPEKFEKERVEFRLTEGEQSTFKPIFVFFKTALGTAGVIHVKSYFNRSLVEFNELNLLHYRSETSMGIKIDIKTFTNYGNPLMR